MRAIARNSARTIILGASLLALGACGGEEPKKAKAPPPPATLPAGQWATQLHVTSYRKMDQGQPGLVMEAGQQVQGGACVPANARTELPPALFVGEGFDCQLSQGAHLENGRINGFMVCRHAGVAGNINIGIDADYTEDSLEGRVSYTTALPGEGDFIIMARLSGRRTGSCDADADAGAAGNSSNTAR